MPYTSTTDENASPARARRTSASAWGRSAYSWNTDCPTSCPGRTPSASSPRPSASVNVPFRSNEKRTSGAPAITVRRRSLLSRSARSWRLRSVTSRLVTIKRVLPHDRHDVEGFLDGRAKLLFAAPKRFLGGGAVDRGGEHARRRLQEVDVVAREGAPPRAVRAEDAERPLLAVDDDAQSAHHTVHVEEGRRTEARFGREILHHHRAGRTEHVPCVRVGRRRHHGPPDAPLPPPHPGPQHQGAARRAQLEHARKIDLQHPGHDGDRGVDQLRDRRPRQRLLAEMRHRLPLMRRRAPRLFRARELDEAVVVVGSEGLDAFGTHGRGRPPELDWEGTR